MSHAERLHEILLQDLERRKTEAEAEVALRTRQIQQLKQDKAIQVPIEEAISCPIVGRYPMGALILCEDCLVN